jgi:hypothetical protein
MALIVAPETGWTAEIKCLLKDDVGVAIAAVSVFREKGIMMAR